MGKYKRKEPKEEVCEYCQKAFLSITKRRTCSEECRIAMMNQSRDDYNRKRRENRKRTEAELRQRRRKNRKEIITLAAKARKQGMTYGEYVSQQNMVSWSSQREAERDGLCRFCNEPVEPGYKVCKKHHQMNIKKARCNNAEKARTTLRNNGILR